MRRTVVVAGVVAGLVVIGLTTLNLAPDAEDSTGTASSTSVAPQPGATGSPAADDATGLTQRESLSTEPGGAAIAPGPGAAVPDTAFAPNQSGSRPSAVVPGKPKVVRTGQVDVEVKDGGVGGAFDLVVALATANQGFVSDSSLNQGDRPSGHLTLRVPTDRLDATLAALGGLGKVGEQRIRGEDVTGQLVDVGARISSLQSQEAALRTLLGKAQTTGEILQVQDQMFAVRTQLEQLQAQQASLADQASYATLTVTLHEPGAAAAAKPSRENVFERAWERAVSNSAAVGSGIILALAWSTPLLALAAVAGLGYRLVRGRRRRPTAATPATSATPATPATGASV